MIKVTIPPKTILKMLLRGISDLSFMSAVREANIKVGSRKGITMQNSGIVVWFERVERNEIIILSVYNKAKRDILIKDRAVSLAGVLTNCLSANIKPLNLMINAKQA